MENSIVEDSAESLGSLLWSPTGSFGKVGIFHLMEIKLSHQVEEVLS